MGALAVRRPQQREDGLCFVCEKSLTRVAFLHADPFCSSVCAREFYGVQLARTAEGGSKHRAIPAGDSGIRVR